MGLSLGGSTGGASSTKTDSSTSTTAQNGGAAQQFTYTPGQQDLQSTLLQSLTSLLTGNGTNPQLQAAQNTSASQINSQYASSGDRVNRYLASRGFGSSGAAGTAALQTELGRQSALSQNASQYGIEGLNLFSQGLTDALNAAYNRTGQTGTTFGNSSTQQNGTQQTDSSNWGFQGGLKLGS